MVFSLPCISRGLGVAATMGVGEKQRGALIVLEGLDRSGKSSQCKALATFLRSRGESVQEWRFPDRTTEIGRMISSYLVGTSNLDDNAVHLLFSANRWEKRALMEATLQAGTTLLVDRYSYSGVAFTAAKRLDLEWCKVQGYERPCFQGDTKGSGPFGFWQNTRMNKTTCRVRKAINCKRNHWSDLLSHGRQMSQL
ncbi:unnamed protein product [Calypogeia fissa]